MPKKDKHKLDIQIRDKIVELEKLQEERNKLTIDDLREKPLLLKMRSGTESKEFWQYFHKSGFENIIHVHKYHSGSFEIASVKKGVGFGTSICGTCHDIFICPTCGEEIPSNSGQDESDRIFIKYSLANSILNFLAEPKPIEKEEE